MRYGTQLAISDIIVGFTTAVLQTMRIVPDLAAILIYALLAMFLIHDVKRSMEIKD